MHDSTRHFIRQEFHDRERIPEATLGAVPLRADFSASDEAGGGCPAVAALIGARDGARSFRMENSTAALKIEINRWIS
jgi:hypothetical protein